MDTISIRYGESLVLPLDAGNEDAVSAAMFIGQAGEAYTLTKSISLTDGKGTFEFSTSDTELPLGTYKYQINVTDGDGFVKKFPSPDNCDGDDCGFPEFVVCESLDETEVVS